MSMFSIFNVSGSAVSAQSQRLNVVASNLANADAVAGPDGKAYKSRQVVFETVPMGSEESSGVKVSCDPRKQRAVQAHAQPNPPRSGCRRLRHPVQREPGRGDGQHDLGLALLPKQRRSHEHRQISAAQDAADGSIS